MTNNPTEASPRRSAVAARESDGRPWGGVGVPADGGCVLSMRGWCDPGVMRGQPVGLLVVLAACLLPAAACGDSASESRTDRPSATRDRAVGPAARSSEPASRGRGPQVPPTDSPERGGWEVGASPLPIRPDGFGRVLRTPAPLRVRRLPTVDRLPPPESKRFVSSVQQIGPRIRSRMGRTWTPHCPVDLEDLRYVTVSFRGFDGDAHTGELILNARVVSDVVSVFRKLYGADFPIETMRLVTGADLGAAPTGDRNNTSAFVCRKARQQSNWSAHAYGLAVDVNPFHNPYRRSGLVLPELASAYLDRGWQRAGMIHGRGVVTDAFDAIGWTWGGSWQNTTDYMHFSATGR